MRVLFITPWYPTQARPAYGVYVREHAKAARLFADVTVLHLDGHRRPRGKPFTVEEETAPEITEGIPTFRAFWKLAPSLLPSLPLRLLAAVAAYRRITLHFKPDVIHAHIFSAGLVATLIGLVTRIPVVITEHSTKFAGMRVSPATRTEAYVAYRLAHAVLPVSSYLLSDLRRWRLPGPYQVVPNVVDTSMFYPVPPRPHKGHKLVFVGALRTDHGKGLPDLLSALQTLIARGFDLSLDVFGDGPKRGELERMAHEFGVNTVVTFHGAVSKVRVAEIVRNADLLVMPSSNCIETFCCPVAEAQAAGIPTVATTVGAIPETLGTDAGILVPPADPIALADGIVTALDHPARWNRDLIASGANQFSVSVVGETLLNVYRQAIEVGNVVKPR